MSRGLWAHEGLAFLESDPYLPECRCAHFGGRDRSLYNQGTCAGGKDSDGISPGATMTVPPRLFTKVCGMVWVVVVVCPLPSAWLEVMGGAPGVLEKPKAEEPGPLVLVLTC